MFTCQWPWQVCRLLQVRARPVAVGMGNFNSESAVAVGLTHARKESVFKLGVTYTDTAGAGVSAGAAFKLK